MQITPAKRVGNVQEYYFSVKLKEIAQMNANGEDIINLGIGSPDLPPSDKVIGTLSENAALPGSHGYQPYVGIIELRRAFSEWYKRWYGVDLDPNNEILPLIGSKEGIMHISMAFLNEGDGVLVPNPGYPTYSSISKLVGAKIYTYDLCEENDWHPNLDALEAANDAGEIDLSNVKLMWCNYPNMPTGANGSVELFEKLVAFGKKHNIVICHDNPYSFILNDKPLSILSIDGAKDICIELNSLSKSSNMPGWRIGMVGTNSIFMQWILRVKSNMDSGMFRPMQLAAVEALNAPKEWYDRMNSVYSSRRDLAFAIMDEIGAEARKEQVGMFLWGKVKGSAKEICDEILYSAKVFVTPGFIFGSQGENYVRISLCCKEERLKEALERIKAIKEIINRG
ncbi:MAG: aminotransferase class I/II-fold pyridoxal phosphate-dependent enzyme [Bacteroidales bacterium]|nr:aminotransferase class I/II-fold pyridoxal phosphate-dependent enzyme [Bacteroidales bacterium]